MAGELIDRGRSLWKDRARAIQLRIRDRFRVAVDRHRDWKVESDYSLGLRRWIRRVWRDSSRSSFQSSSSSRFYRKRVGKDVDAINDSIIVRMLQALAVPIIGNACHAFMHGLNHIQIYGAEKFHQALLQRKDGKPLLTVSNHVAAVDDPFVVASLLPPSAMFDVRSLRWTLCATDRCFSNPVLSAFFRCVKVLPVTRGDGIYQKGMDMALSKLNNGGWVHIFPEGSRSMDGGRTMGSSKRGVGRLVMDADSLPVVIPFVHTGMQEILPVGVHFPNIGKRVTVVVGDPIHFDDLLNDAQDVSRGLLYDAVSSRIGHRLEELKAQADRLALEQQSEVQEFHIHNSKHGSGIWQQVDWEAFGMGNVMLSDEDSSQIVKPMVTNKPKDDTQGQPQMPDSAHRTIRMGFSYEGGIVSRIRGYMNPTELMGFAARGLFMNGRMLDGGRRNAQAPGPVKAWKQLVNGRMLDEGCRNIQEASPIKAWKQFFEGSVLNLWNRV